MYGAQQRSVSDAAEPMLMAQAARYNTDMAAAQAEMAAATTPEAQAAATQRMQMIQQQQFTVPQGQTPSQFMQGALGNEFSGTVSGQPMIVNTPQQGTPVAPVTGKPKADPSKDLDTFSSQVKQDDRDAALQNRQRLVDAEVSAGRIPWQYNADAVRAIDTLPTDAAVNWLAAQYPTIPLDQIRVQVETRNKKDRSRIMRPTFH
jgi:hypothetical protein